MTKTAPIYLATILSDDRSHICVGVNPETLCEEDRVTSAAQIGMHDSPLDIIEESSRTICSDCEDRWNAISDQISSEVTVECHRCNSNYNAADARMISHRRDEDVSVCRECYNQLLDNEDSGVEIPYEDAEPYHSSVENEDRTAPKLDFEEE